MSAVKRNECGPHSRPVTTDSLFSALPLVIPDAGWPAARPPVGWLVAGGVRTPRRPKAPSKNIFPPPPPGAAQARPPHPARRPWEDGSSPSIALSPEQTDLEC